MKYPFLEVETFSRARLQEYFGVHGDDSRDDWIAKFYSFTFSYITRLNLRSKQDDIRLYLWLQREISLVDG